MSYSKAVQYCVEHYGEDHPDFYTLVEMHMYRGY